MSQDQLGTSVMSNELVRNKAECFKMVKKIMDSTLNNKVGEVKEQPGLVTERCVVLTGTLLI